MSLDRFHSWKEISGYSWIRLIFALSCTTTVTWNITTVDFNVKYLETHNSRIEHGFFYSIDNN